MCYLENLRTLAHSVGVEQANQIISKKELVRSIQKAHHPKACFQCEDRFSCKDIRCKWRESCQTSLVEFIN